MLQSSDIRLDRLTNTADYLTDTRVKYTPNTEQNVWRASCDLLSSLFFNPARHMSKQIASLQFLFG
jgi:hypothetical protein